MVAEAVFEEAIRLVSRHQVASCSFLQRQLRVSYADGQAILARLRNSNHIPLAHSNITVAEIAKKWAGEHSSTSRAVQSVSSTFFEVATGVSFSSTDLYCALICGKDSDDISVAYGKAFAVGLRRADAVVMTLLKRLSEDMCSRPADGLVLKITSDPTRLLGHEIRQICLALRGHTAQHCITALAIRYDTLGEGLLLEALTSRITHLYPAISLARMLTPPT